MKNLIDCCKFIIQRFFVYLFVIMSLLMTEALPIFAQDNRMVKGVVKDQSGEPLLGVTVIEKGTTNATSTHNNGDFELKLTKKHATLLFSYVGFTSFEKQVMAGTNLMVEMTEESLQLDDVIVIGYGTAKKSDLTGAVSSLSKEAMTDKLVLSVEDALRGKLAGVTIRNADGAPGSDMHIRIRGAGSINATNSPLYVVDGILMESTDVSPAEIESIEILKDASSTAIYGSRGANGVVVITTKRGVRGKPRVNFSAQLSVQQPVRLYEMMNSLEYTKYTSFGVGRVMSSPIDYYNREGNLYQLSNSSVYALRYQEILDGTFTIDTNWQKEMMQNALIQDYRFSIGGADEAGSYSVMGSVLSQDGIIIESGMKRYNVRANFDRNLTSKFKIGVNVSGSIINTDGVTGNVINTMLAQPPIKELNTQVWIASDGEDQTINNNPYLQAKNVTNFVSRKNVVLKTYGDYKFSKLFRLNVSGSYTYGNSHTRLFYPSDVITGGGVTYNGSARQNRVESTDWLNENLLYITPKKHGIHALDFLVGFTLQGKTVENESIEVHDFPREKMNDEFWNWRYGTDAVIPVNSKTNWRMVSFLGRANYKINEKYLFTVSMRADGSSVLAKGGRWGYFPSGAFAWRAGEENFIKKLNIFSNLKFRTSVGLTGNSAISPYQTQALLGISNYPINGFDKDYGLVMNSTINDDLRWEKSLQFDAGVDIGFFNNCLNVVFDWYYKKTRDVLLKESLPNYTGYVTRWTNRGKIDNMGVELTIEGVPVRTKYFEWNSSLNLSHNHSKVIYISNSGWMNLDSSAGGATNFGRLQHGESLGTFFGYEEHGVFRSQAEIDESGITAIFGSAIRPGYVKYVDQNGDHVIDENDRTILGCAEPDFMGGFTNEFKYRGIGLQIGLEFSYGGKVFNATRMSVESSKGAGVNQTKRAAQYGYYPTLYDWNTGALVHQGNEDIAYIRTPILPTEPSDYTCRSLYVEDASYLRVSYITLSFDLARKKIKKLGMQSARFFASVNNPFLWTKYTGYDPEVNSMTGVSKDLLPGVDNYAYPRTRTFSCGVDVTF